MNLRNKRILITAGPTWVAIDKVRVISNIASGETGILLSREAKRTGAKVTLLLGPGVSTCCLPRTVRVVHFRFFDELQKQMLGELLKHKYDAVIHCAAVADYRLRKVFGGKIGSDRKGLKLGLEPTPKILDMIRKEASSSVLAAFKFQPQALRSELLNKSRTLMARSGSDIVVANTVNNGKYKAYILKPDAVSGPLYSKKALSAALIKEIGAYICKN